MQSLTPFAVATGTDKARKRRNEYRRMRLARVCAAKMGLPSRKYIRPKEVEEILEQYSAWRPPAPAEPPVAAAPPPAAAAPPSPAPVDFRRFVLEELRRMQQQFDRHCGSISERIERDIQAVQAMGRGRRRQIL
eukprot:tig00000492_g1554.t1